MAAPATMLPQCDERELQDRRDAVESTLGTTLAEGVSPSPEVLALFEAYANGTISLDDILPSVRALDGH
ncbi:MAG TPA: antitoxin VbhA family protein [Acidobacteriaceae bacterium]|nr:antitoxin VbhA family protein [Acidobacteriaceae bacterium]